MAPPLIDQWATYATSMRLLPCRVVSLEPTDFSDMMETVMIVGRECGVEDRAKEIVQRMGAGLEGIR
jgi:hypothetical protein